MGRGPGQPAPGGLLVVGALPQRGHQHGQKASLQQQGIPTERRNSTQGLYSTLLLPTEGPPREASTPTPPHPTLPPVAPHPVVTHHWK